MAALNLSLLVTADSVQIVNNGKDIVKSIHIFYEQERNDKIAWMQQNLDTMVANNPQS